MEDPQGFFDQYRHGVVIDDFHRAPYLFSYVQQLVDHDDRPGQFVLIGSQNVLPMRSISQTLAINQTLADRCAFLHLLPFSFTELASLPAVEVSASAATAPPAASRGSRPDAHPGSRLLPRDS